MMKHFHHQTQINKQNNYLSKVVHSFLPATVETEIGGSQCRLACAKTSFQKPASGAHISATVGSLNSRTMVQGVLGKKGDLSQK
jgi:hypothetical protein